MLIRNFGIAGVLFTRIQPDIDMFSPKWYNLRLFLLCFFGVAFGAMNSVLSSAYLPDITRDLLGIMGNEAAGRVGAWINFAFLAGGTAGGIGLSVVSDRIGRRAVLLLALLCYGMGSALGALAGTWEVLAATRVLVGVGVGAMLVVSAVVIAEVWDSRSRAVALGILSVAYPVGIIFSGLVTAGVHDWRMGFALGALALLLAFPAYWWVQETAEWSERKKLQQPVSLTEYNSVLFSGIVVYGTMLIGLWAAFSWLPTWVQSLFDSGTHSGQAERGLSVGLLGGGGLIGGILSGFLANRFGGRRVQAVCFGLCFLLSFYLFQCLVVYSMQVPVGIAMLGICFGISQGVLNEYIPELFPAAVRSAATGLCFHVGRAFTAVAVFFVGALVVWFGGYGNAIFAFSTVYIAGLLALLFVAPAGPKALDDLDL